LNFPKVTFCGLPRRKQVAVLKKITFQLLSLEGNRVETFWFMQISNPISPSSLSPLAGYRLFVQNDRGYATVDRPRRFGQSPGKWPYARLFPLAG
jgi:hypothetical protein